MTKREIDGTPCEKCSTELVTVSHMYKDMCPYHGVPIHQAPTIIDNLDPLEATKAIVVAIASNCTLDEVAQAIDGYARARIKANNKELKKAVAKQVGDVASALDADLASALVALLNEMDE